MIYFIFLFIILLSLQIEREDGCRTTIYRIPIAVLYILLIGLRGKYIGVDTPTYYKHFYTYGQWGCKFVEPGFDYINQVLYHMGLGANSLFLVMSILQVSFLYLAIKDMPFKQYSICAICFYTLTFSFLVNGIRQGVPLAIFVYCYKFIKEGKIVPYVVLLSLGSFIHATSLLLIPLYFTRYLNVSTKWTIIIYMLSFLAVFIDISNYIPSFQLGNREYGQFSDGVKIKAASYVGFIISTALNILVYILMIKNETFKKYPVLCFLVLCAFVLKNLGYNLPIISRLTIYFQWFIFLLYPILLADEKYLFRSKQITLLLLIGINVAIWINGLLSPSNHIMPYTFCWEN